MTSPLTTHPDGTVVRVRAVPGASSAGVVGVVGDEVRIRVCSPPVDGRANDEVIEVLAASIGMKRRQLSLVAGHTTRSKRVLVEASVESLHTWLEGLGG